MFWNRSVIVISVCPLGKPNQIASETCRLHAGVGLTSAPRGTFATRFQPQCATVAHPYCRQLTTAAHSFPCRVISRRESVPQLTTGKHVPYNLQHSMGCASSASLEELSGKVDGPFDRPVGTPWYRNPDLFEESPQQRAFADKMDKRVGVVTAQPPSAHGADPMGVTAEVDSPSAAASVGATPALSCASSSALTLSSGGVDGEASESIGLGTGAVVPYKVSLRKDIFARFPRSRHLCIVTVVNRGRATLRLVTQPAVTFAGATADMFPPPKEIPPRHRGVFLCVARPGRDAIAGSVVYSYTCPKRMSQAQLLCGWSVRPGGNTCNAVVRDVVNSDPDLLCRWDYHVANFSHSMHSTMWTEHPRSVHVDAGLLARGGIQQHRRTEAVFVFESVG